MKPDTAMNKDVFVDRFYKFALNPQIRSDGAIVTECAHITTVATSQLTYTSKIYLCIRATWRYQRKAYLSFLGCFCNLYPNSVGHAMVFISSIIPILNFRL